MAEARADENDGTNLNRFLTIARAGAVGVCGLMIVFGTTALTGPLPPLYVLGEFVGYNAVAGAYGLTAWRHGQKRLYLLVAVDLLETSVILGVTGGYASPYFAMLLFAMAETAVYVDWRMGAALIVTVNAVQIIAAGIQAAAFRNAALSSFIVNRFLLLLVVGLLFVVLAESLRREEKARRSAVRLSLQAENLNSIFAQLGEAHLDVEKVFNTVFSAVASLGSVQFSAILQRSSADPNWKVAATSREGMCPIGLVFDEALPSVHEEGEISRPLVLKKADAPAAPIRCPDGMACDQLTSWDMPAYSDSEAGMLVVCRDAAQPLARDDETFLQALALQAQLAIHNSLLLRERQRQLERLEKFKQVQDSFFSAAAHELKTPLTVLELLVSSLRMSVRSPSPEQDEMFLTIEQNVGRLRTHSENMLDAARLESADVVLSRTRVDARRIAHVSFGGMRRLFTDKRVKVQFDPDLPWPPVEADSDRLGDIFGNLLSNAVKFAPAGSEVTVGFRPDGDDAVLSVCNTGPSVPEDERERIFEKYYTASDAGARAGTGLGLYIVKELVELHGGTIWLDGTPDVTCFRFSLPFARPGEPEGDE